MRRPQPRSTLFPYTTLFRSAYRELNDFEQELTDHGSIVVKFWMHISREEQLRRFKSREETAYKQHKINDEDWRNRRSEEHTSELQSRPHLVCRLLLEKKNQQ